MSTSGVAAEQGLDMKGKIVPLPPQARQVPDYVGVDRMCFASACARGTDTVQGSGKKYWAAK